MENMFWIGIVAGILTSVSMLPQLIKILKEKDAQNVSIVMIIVLISGLSVWIVYGVMREDWPLIVTNSFSVLVNTLILIFRIKYSGVKETKE
ncbi:MAG TPA: SemiSWEET transporter [Flavisolibacter sp.]|jgi:MtN3 and saliva related transmembrane protein|nr:SemiSWEET transporter [Flavisolibacter sp.]